MGTSFISTVGHYGEIIDCRCLTLAFEYYDFTKTEVMSLLQDTVQWVEQWTDGTFISERTINGKRFSKENAYSVAQNLFSQRQWLAYGQDFFAISNNIYNKKTLNSYLKKIRTGTIPARQRMSIDYPDYWEHLFSFNKELSSAVVVENILTIFREKGKCPLSYYPLPDIQMLYTALPYKQHCGKYYGKFFINISTFCIGNELQHMSEVLSAFANNISTQYLKLNARVQLQPVGAAIRNPYMRYFGARGRIDGSHEDAMCTEKEWYQTYYLPGSEWFNIVSPLAQIHLSDISTDGHHTNAITKTNNGALIIQSNVALSDYDVDDAKSIKELLYPALYPGNCVLPLKKLIQVGTEKFNYDIFPRCEWEIVPIFDKELYIIGTDLVFCHRI